MDWPKRPKERDELIRDTALFESEKILQHHLREAISDLASTPITELVSLIMRISEATAADLAQIRGERKQMLEIMLNVEQITCDFANKYDKLRRDKAISKIIERETLRQGIDNWFWRPEPAMEFRNQLRKRAGYLKANQYTLDQAWVLLCDFVAGWTIEDIDEELLKTVLAERYRK